MDRVGVGLLGLAALTETLVHLDRPVVAGLAILLAAAALATTVPLLLPWPTAAAVAVVAAGVLSLAFLDRATIAGIAAQLLAAWGLGRRGSLVVAAGCGLGYLPIALAGAPAVAVLTAALLPAAALAGAARRTHQADLANRAERQAFAGTLVEHTARGERTRIARELHDVVAHHVSMVVVQAESARLTTPGMPALGAQRLTAIGDTGRSALTEMRRLLGVLRSETGDLGGAAPERQPQPGLRQLADLLDEARDTSGAGTRLIVSGTPAALDPGTELAAYRIVQEAMSNTRRHAPGAAVDVEVHYTATALRLTVRDNGPGLAAAAPAGGHGLLGMRERAAAVGGILRTGSADPGGFLVEATLPTRTEDLT